MTAYHQVKDKLNYVWDAWLSARVERRLQNEEKMIKVVIVDCSLRFLLKCLTQDFIITKLNLNFQQVQELVFLGQRRLFVLLQHLLKAEYNIINSITIFAPSSFSPVCRSLFQVSLPPLDSPK